MGHMAKLLELTEALKALEEVETVVYLQTWEELAVFLASLGSVFGFITSDVKDKIEIVRKHMTYHGDAFRTIPSLMKFEVANKLTGGSRGLQSASRSIQRLHRALAFISLFLEKLEQCEDNASPSKLASEAYGSTLANFHPWLVRKSVGIALHTLPSRPVLFQRMFGQETKIPNMLGTISSNCQPVYDKVQRTLTELDLLQLN